MQVRDTATLNGGISPSGSVTFTLYSDNQCTLAVPGVSGARMISNGPLAGASYATTWTPSTAGTYNWIATYAGDTYNHPVSSTCGDPDEQIVIGVTPTPALATEATGPVTVGQAIHDVATLSGGVNPMGSISFTVFAPGDATCETPIGVPPDQTVNGNGPSTSGDYITVGVMQSSQAFCSRNSPLGYWPSTSAMPSSTRWMRRSLSWPTSSSRIPRSIAATSELFATASCGSPVLSLLSSTLPGSLARRRLLVSGTITTVRMRLRLKALLCTTTTGRR